MNIYTINTELLYPDQCYLFLLFYDWLLIELNILPWTNIRAIPTIMLIKRIADNAQNH